MKREPLNVDRRRWMIDLTRGSVLAGLGLLSAGLLARQAGSCLSVSLPCHDCTLLAACELPRAESAKQDSQRQAATSDAKDKS